MIKFIIFKEIISPNDSYFISCFVNPDFFFFFNLGSETSQQNITQSSKPHLEVVIVSISCSRLQSQPLHKRPTSVGVAGMSRQDMYTFLFGDQHLGQPQSSVVSVLDLWMKTEFLSKLNKRICGREKKKEEPDHSLAWNDCEIWKPGGRSHIV